MNTELIKSPQNSPFNYLDGPSFDALQKACKMFVNSELVPDIYRISGKGNTEAKAIANCMIAVEMAHRLQMSPLMVMQNLSPIQGKPSFSSKFLISLINSCGTFEPIEFKIESLGILDKVTYTDYEWKVDKKVPVEKIFQGPIDNLKCTASTRRKDSEKILSSTPVTIEMAIKEGWYTKNGSKWRTMPELMLQYRAASFWNSIHSPDLSMGFRTTEEVTDTLDINFEEVTDKVNKEIAENANTEKYEIKSPIKEEGKKETVAAPF